MASGFEVVGLALAIFPLLVEGLKFYKEHKGHARDFIQYRRVLRQIRFLESISVYYGLGAHEILEMVKDPQDARWRRKILFDEDSTRESSVTVFMETVEDMNEVLIKIQDLVGLRGNAQVSDDRVGSRFSGRRLPNFRRQPAMLDKSTLRRQWDKVALVLGENDIKGHLERARGLNIFLA
ncbi:uncharacterized protein N7482_001954 [Penicillium canariense]|uniref:Prion-inhibition and propagation HeLo domain-containing protein n=1 Tax=Penicillium canariense TaxID=189055 RepID=A0A9W9IGM6_9EURO|nr:uncharacterized protein N7482_001954 [Penicillium canariense]KAJ5176077.1 hypothetical protein N7482_001954 [Penicillium canariense]